MGNRIKNGLLRGLVILCACVTVGSLIALVVYILSRGAGQLSWGFITGNYSALKGEMGIWPMIVSTLYLVGLTTLIACPIGVCAAIYLTEYAKPGRLLRIITFTTETLSGIPSIIFGLFGYIFFVDQLGMQWSLMACALTVTLMVLPTIVRTVQESILAVPVSFREASLALGATQLSTIVRVVLPSALPGIFSAVILAMGRMVGETAAVFLTYGMVTRIPTGLFSPGRTLAVHLYALAGEAVDQSYWDAAFGTAAVLIILVAIINFSADAISSHIAKKKRGN